MTSSELARASHASLLDAPSVLAKTLRDLEWDRLVAALASRCRGPLHDSLQAIPLASSLDEARMWMSETQEALVARRNGEPLPLHGIRDVRSALARATKLGVLSGFELAGIRSTLGSARVLRKFLSARKAHFVQLNRRCHLDPTLDGLEEEIGACIEPGGTIADHASPELRRLRTEVAHLRARIVQRLEQMLIEHEAVIQDRFLTLREGRYVIPVRTDAHERLPGIVHGTSSSGATAFIEPRAIVDSQNRLTLAVSEMEREEQRILAQLSDLVRERAPELAAALDALDLADLRDASARLADDLRAWPPELTEESCIEATSARHPLLALDGVAVVANDLSLRGGHALVISGPNAGGKTVALKLMGILALMARSGLPLPCAEGARIGYFEEIISDVGDEQSMQMNLSTFSAHVKSMARTLDLAGPRSLVLLDEVATGTDPAEGAALACAIVDSLARRGAAVAVTTHYEALKAMALSDDRFRNASVGFDIERMAPTFAVRMDVPGASSALAVAARFGLDPLVIERAREMLPEQVKNFDALVRKLESEHDAVHRVREALEQEKRLAAEVRERSEVELRKMRERDKQKLTTEGERLLVMIRETRDEVKAARQAMRKSPSDLAVLEAAKAAVERAQKLATGDSEIASALRPDLSQHAGTPLKEAELTIGQRVFIPRLKAEAEIIEGPQKDKVRVAAGAVKLWIDIEELRTKKTPRVDDSKRRTKEEAIEPPPASGRGIRTESNSLDVRGMRVDDAIGMTESFLDRLYGSSERIGYLVHGVGTGALRDGLREFLRAAKRYVIRIRPGDFDEGGDRITVVEIR